MASISLLDKPSSGIGSAWYLSLLCLLLLAYTQTTSASPLAERGQDGRPPKVHWSFRGKIFDKSNGEPLKGAIVTLYAEAGDDEANLDPNTLQSRLGYGISHADGSFQVTLSHTEAPADKVYATIRLLGYQTQLLVIPIQQPRDTTIIYLEEDRKSLPEVLVLGAPIQAQGDTIIYQAEAFQTPLTYSAEDLLQELPGISVGESGHITYLGEPIQGVYIEGVDLVADSYQTATRIVKAEDIRAVEVLERFQRVKALRGLKEGSGAMINLRLKESQMLHPSGDLKVGAGAMQKGGVGSIGGNTLLVNRRTQLLATLELSNSHTEPPTAGTQDEAYLAQASASFRQHIGNHARPVGQVTDTH